ncbi:MAG TPA: chemotaxis protein CheB, partial [Cytophagales bacterium]|nr:chemotaxis protein CheB [Cytophagales bacterium]
METLPTYEAVVIGGSWGGTEAIIDILKELPAGYGLPIIVVLHRQKNTESYLAHILGRHLHMEVREINEKETIMPGIVYVAPAN